MTVATKILMGSGAIAEPNAIDINQSLIFDDSSSSYLARTPSSASNRGIFTFSCWYKRSFISSSTDQVLFSAYSGSSGSDTTFFQIRVSGASGPGLDALSVNGWNTNWRVTNRLFRDPSSWYHIIVVVNTADGTANNRIRIYVNGVEETSFAQINTIGQNVSTGVNTTVPHSLGRINKSGDYRYLDGYLAETHFIDGAAEEPTDFGKINEATGQWLPIAYAGSYGTNGFYLKFASGAIGTDSSGNSNTYSATNLANHDVVIDTPTNNFATLNSIAGVTEAMGLSEGNLNGNFKAGSVVNGSDAFSTIAMSVGSGKWYWEMRQTYTGQGFSIGISPKAQEPTMTFPGNLGYDYYNANGGKKYSAAGQGRDSYGTAWFTSGQTYIMSVYYDSDLGKIGFKLNGADQGFAFTNVVASDYVAGFANVSGGTSTFPAVVNFGQNGTFSGAVTAQGNADANGIGNFYYAVPSGYKALCTANLPDPAIPLPSAHFNTVLYNGTGSTPQTVTGVGFQPDFVWIKNRPTGGTNYVMYDAVRGTNKTIASSTTNAESSDDAAGFSAFTSDGFTLRSLTTAQGTQNTLNQSQVSWNWKANGSESTDTSGDIDAVVSANQAAGFSVVTWTATGSNTATIPHGLGVAPEIIFYKARSTSGNWNTWTTAIDGSNDSLLLNTTAAKSDNSGSYGNLTSSFFPNWGLGNGITMVAYSFASKPGFSKIGVYTGNGSATAGPFVNCGFKPAWLLIKNTSNAQDWILFDNKRDPSNVTQQFLYPNLNNAEAAGGANVLDLVSNGFKLRNAGTRNRNYNGDVYFFMAFADSPFKTATAH